jgi:hypothetical protein
MLAKTSAHRSCMSLAGFTGPGLWAHTARRKPIIIISTGSYSRVSPTPLGQQFPGPQHAHSAKRPHNQPEITRIIPIRAAHH